MALFFAFAVALVASAMGTTSGTRPAAAAPTTLLQQANYTFSCPTPNELYQCDPGTTLPDAATWTVDRVPTVDDSAWCVGGSASVAQCAYPYSGLAMSDQGNGSQLLYEYLPTSLSGDAASPAHYNTAKFRVVSRADHIPDGSSAWSANSVGWRMIFDDGWHRLELKFSRSTTWRRQVWIGNTAIAPFEFPWDNTIGNTYEIERHSNGDFTVTLTNGDISSPSPTQTRFIPGGMLPWTYGTPMAAWGMGGEGGGTAAWTEVHFEVNRATGSVAGKGSIDSPAGAMAENLAATGQAKFSVSAKYAKGIPAGQVAFDFRGGGLSFRSAAIESLSIVAAGAEFQGRGTVNGTGDYRFILRAVDGDLAEGGVVDAFHIRIWDPQTYNGHNATYDNQPGLDPWWSDATWPLSGGSITIR